MTVSAASVLHNWIAI